MLTKEQELKGKIILTIAISILMISIGLQTVHAFEEDNYIVDFEYINTKDMAPTTVTTKVVVEEDKKLSSLLINNLNMSKDDDVVEVSLNDLDVEEVKIEPVKSVEQAPPRQVWRLPTEMGTISQYPSYWHAAYDITSPRGSNEPIFPVANGTISNIYRDPAGALVVTVLHNIDGKFYTSQYAHLSSFASDIYIGKEVTVNDCLGLMGTTGYSTGVHLHIAVVDCALFDPNDPYCSNLNSFFSYAKTRTSQGYLGLGQHVYVPSSWSSR